MKPDKFKLALVQMKMSENRGENLSRALEMVREAHDAGAKVVCLPELFLTPYFCKIEDHCFFNLAEELPSHCSRAVSHAAADMEVAIVASLFEKRAAGLYHNTCLTFDEKGKTAGMYRKMHIPDDPGFYEKFYFTPGDLGYQAATVEAGVIGTLVCWDQWYPEAARLTAMKGANVLVYPTAIGWLPEEKAEHGVKQHQAWQTVQRGHAVANGVYVAACNRCGYEESPDGKGGIEFWGQSFICDPMGQVIAEASSDKEEIIYGDIDNRVLESTRQVWPFFRDRRIDSYTDINKRFGNC